MRVATISTTTCPRCYAPVGGDFKYCPECAYRLRASPAPEPVPTQAGRRGPFLLAMSAALLLLGGYLVGQLVLGDPERSVQLVPDVPQPMTVLGIQDQLVRISPGMAAYMPEGVWTAPETNEAIWGLWADFETDRLEGFLYSTTTSPQALTRWGKLLSIFYDRTEEMVEEKDRYVPVFTWPLQMMRHEVTCGQWGEFLTAVQQDPSILSRRSWIQDFWRPPEEESDTEEKTDAPEYWRYSSEYWRIWWRHVVEHHQARRALQEEADDEAEIIIPAQPAFLDNPGLTDQQAVLILIPPAWVRIHPETGVISWVMEEGTEDLPVTGISWWDAHMFVEWAKEYLGITSLRLPNWGEWARAFHAGHPNLPKNEFDSQGDPGRKWPWGNEPDPNGCNNLNYALNKTHPILRSARSEYTYHRGRTAEGVLNMAGNAAEWTDNWTWGRRKNMPLGPLIMETKETLLNEAGVPYNQTNAYAIGGSYLSGLDDCSVGGRLSLDKRDRPIDVGFRLILDAGIGR